MGEPIHGSAPSGAHVHVGAADLEALSAEARRAHATARGAALMKRIAGLEVAIVNGTATDGEISENVALTAALRVWRRVASVAMRPPGRF
ncbi:hypothetical protein ETD86_29475 [Nonomuraea turkmeniaca]|uniref:Uncharacterized protein n=1 Tax=Nonomuraea turkmeniaca TaxID=103838 RepID=A0A5S4FAH3_9ACTN|nr:hypothetical protein [Nonomuraea turkmeniaca]TMR14079.1 hypothetical protein ETD86_29475 [Nonomuraea turkmeniaca]